MNAWCCVSQLLRLGFDHWRLQNRLAVVAHATAQATTAKIHSELTQLSGDPASPGRSTALAATADVMVALAARRSEADAATTQARLAQEAATSQQSELATRNAELEARAQELDTRELVCACVHVRTCVNVSLWALVFV